MQPGHDLSPGVHGVNARSARLFVSRMGPAPAAVLLQLEPLARVRLALGGHVVPSLALLASERQRRSFVGSHIFSNPCLGFQRRS